MNYSIGHLMTIVLYTMNHTNRIKVFCLSTALVSAPIFTAEETEQPDTDELMQCVYEELKKAHDSTTIAELKALCTQEEEETSDEEAEENEVIDLSELLPSTEEKSEGVISRRAKAEASTAFNPYVITPHKMNYILPVSTTDNVNLDPYRTTTDWADDLYDTETKLQLSFKVPLNKDDIFVKDDKFFFGFTLKSWWQVYSDNISKPFRETNYQPEFFYTTPLALSVGQTNSAFAIGIEHQSNGRSQGLSRSWNRIYLNWLFEYQDFALSFRPWYRIPEDRKTDPLASDGDDNPDIEDFMGYFELGMAYQWDDYEFHIIGHQNFSTMRGGAELGVTFPIWGRLRGYLQYFGGYGESMIDYNHSQNRIGIGFALTDLL